MVKIRSKKVIGIMLSIVCLLTIGEIMNIMHYTSFLYVNIFEAQESVTINNCEMVLDTYLWRDLTPYISSPYSPPDQIRYLNAILTVVPKNGNITIDFYFEIDYLWVRNGLSIWTHDINTRIIDHSTSVSDGPLWETHVEVDVVVQLIDDSNNDYLLQAKDQRIHVIW